MYITVHDRRMNVDFIISQRVVYHSTTMSNYLCVRYCRFLIYEITYSYISSVA